MEKDEKINELEEILDITERQYEYQLQENKSLMEEIEKLRLKVDSQDGVIEELNKTIYALTIENMEVKNVSKDEAFTEISCSDIEIDKNDREFVMEDFKKGGIRYVEETEQCFFIVPWWDPGGTLV